MIHSVTTFSFACLMASVLGYADPESTAEPFPERPVYDSMGFEEGLTAANRYKGALLDIAQKLEQPIAPEQKPHFIWWLRGIDDGPVVACNRENVGRYSWIENAVMMGFEDPIVRTLHEKEVFLADEQWKEVFEAYLSMDYSLLITTDSVLNVFHRLLEDSLFRIELHRQEKLRLWIMGMHSRLNAERKELAKGMGLSSPRWYHRLPFWADHDASRADVQLFEQAFRYANTVLSVAMGLVGEPVSYSSPEERRLVEGVLKAVEKGEGRFLPEFMSPSSADCEAIDFTRFKPHGFYAQHADLARTFRAVKWLQSIPFRIDRDQELLAMALIVNCALDDGNWPDLIPLGPETLFLGDEWVLPFGLSSWSIPEDLFPRNDSEMDVRSSLYLWRKKLKDDFKVTPFSPQGDLIRTESHQSGEPYYAFRLFPSFAFPEVELRNAVGDAYEMGVTSSSVLALLSSEWGLQRLLSSCVKQSDAETVMNFVKQHTAQYLGPRNANRLIPYHNYLRVLATLVENGDSGQPSFMNSQIWKLKSSNAVLASWAQMRYAMSLVLQEYASYFSIPPPMIGFVEPNREFYGELASCSKSMLERLVLYGLTSPAYSVHSRIAGCQSVIDLIERERLDKDAISKSELREIESKDRLTFGRLLREAEMRTQAAGEYFWGLVESGEETTKPKKLMRIKKELVKEIEDLRNNPKAAEDYEDPSILIRWIDFVDLCRRLERMVLVQSRDEEWSPDDWGFFHKYGSTIAEIMGYEDSSMFTPKDDTPRIVTVEADPNTAEYLNVGISRPRALFVLFPWKGKRVLCRGAVMPYHEMIRSDRMEASSWKALLDGSEGDRPVPWMIEEGFPGNRSGTLTFGQN